jgi:hypothetical protein
MDLGGRGRAGARPGPEGAARGGRSSPAGPPGRSSCPHGVPQGQVRRRRPGGPAGRGKAGRCGMPHSRGGCRPPGTRSPPPPPRAPGGGRGRGRAGTAPLGAANDRWRAANGPRRPSVPGGRIPRAFSPPTADGTPGRAPRERTTRAGPDGRRREDRATWAGASVMGRPEGPAATRPRGGGSVRHGTVVALGRRSAAGVDENVDAAEFLRSGPHPHPI